MCASPPPPLGDLLPGIRQTCSGRLWRYRLLREHEGKAQVMTQLYGFPDLLSRLLAARQIDPQEAQTYLTPSLRQLLPDPYQLTDMEKAVTLMLKHLHGHAPIALFGDYDVDGACSLTLMADFLHACGAKTLLHVPDRITEGYGPHIEAIHLLYQKGARLLLTLDCGTTSQEVLEQAQAMGMEIIVIDHHLPSEALPRVAAIVNPNRNEDTSGLTYLCATGVVFMVLVALHRALREQAFWTEIRPAPDLLAALDIVALATIADVVPLFGLNRAFVTTGLQVMHQRQRVGLRALLDLARVQGPPTPYVLGFILGPRINAGGRIGDASLGVQLLCERAEGKAQHIAQELDRLNQERQVMELITLQEAESLVSLEGEDQGAAIIVAAKGWHKGLVGLIAARLKERFHKPAFALAFEGDIGTGSARSIPGVDLGHLIHQALARGLILKGGGHAMAAGLTLHKDQWEGFRTFVETEIAHDVRNARGHAATLVDAHLTATAIKPELVHLIEKAGPFGLGNPEPLFVFSAHRIRNVKEIGTQHMGFQIESQDGTRMDAIAFRAQGSPLGHALKSAQGDLRHIAGYVGINHWQGREKVQVRVADLAS